MGQLGSEFHTDISKYHKMSGLTWRMWFFVLMLIVGVGASTGLLLLEFSETMSTMVAFVFVIPGGIIGLNQDKNFMRWYKYQISEHYRNYNTQKYKEELLYNGNFKPAKGVSEVKKSSDR